MVEPLFRIEAIPAGLIAGATIELGGAEAKHAISVRRMRIGEAIALTDGRGSRIRGLVQSIEDRVLTVEVKAIEVESEPKLRLTLVQALAKGDRDELAIQAATEIGAWAVVPWQATRSISKWDAVKAKKGQERWQAIVTEAAKQSLRAFHPEVRQVVNSAELTTLIKSGLPALVLDPTAPTGLAKANLDKLEGELLVIVGPEGGISPEELERFEQAGANRVHLGDSILRTSTAGVVAMAALQALLGAYS